SSLLCFPASLFPSTYFERGSSNATERPFILPPLSPVSPPRRRADGLACTVRQWAWRTLWRKLAGKTRGLTGQNLSPRSVRIGGDDRVRTHCVSLLVPSEEAADS